MGERKTPDENNKPLWFLGGFAWIALVVVGYYIFHTPLNQNQAILIGSGLLDILISCILLSTAGGIGRSMLKLEDLLPGERITVQVALGIGLLAITWLVLGLAGLFQTWAAWLFLLVGLILFWKQIAGWGKDLRDALQTIRFRGNLEKLFGAGLGFLLAVQLLNALTPAVSWDALMYHLALPGDYLAAGRFTLIPENVYWGQPQLVEMIFTLCGALFRWETATVFSWMLLLILLIGLRETLAAHDTTAALVGLVALMVGETFRVSHSSGYVDGVSAFMGYAVWISLLRWMKTRKPRHSFWIGIFSGLAIWVKITNGLFLVVIGISILVENILMKKNWFSGLLAPGVGLIVFLPWLVILQVFTGNFIYPHFFQSGLVDSVRYQFFQTPGTSPGWRALWLPLSATWHGLDTVYVQDQLLFATDIGPLLLGLGFFSLTSRRINREIRNALIWIGTGWLAMILGGMRTAVLWQTRLYYGLIPAAVILAGFGWRDLRRIRFRGARLQIVAGGLVLLVLGFAVLQDLRSLVSSGAPGYLLGVRSKEEYFDQNLGWYHRAVKAVSELPENSNTLFLWEPRGFYAPENSRADVWIDQWYLDLRRHGSADAVLESWLKEGYTHLLLASKARDFEMQSRKEYLPTDWDSLDKLLNQLSAPSSFGEVYYLYELK